MNVCPICEASLIHYTLYMGNLVAVYTCITYFPVGKKKKTRHHQFWSRPDDQKLETFFYFTDGYLLFTIDGDCSYGGNIYKNGMEWRQGCDLRCVCDSGEVTCHNLCTSTPPPPTSDCPYPVQVSVPDTCCKEWLCYDGKFPDHRTWRLFYHTQLVHWMVFILGSHKWLLLC